MRVCVYVRVSVYLFLRKCDACVFDIAIDVDIVVCAISKHHFPFCILQIFCPMNLDVTDKETLIGKPVLLNAW